MGLGHRQFGSQRAALDELAYELTQLRASGCQQGAAARSSARPLSRTPAQDRRRTLHSSDPSKGRTLIPTTHGEPIQVSPAMLRIERRPIQVVLTLPHIERGPIQVAPAIWRIERGPTQVASAIWRIERGPIQVALALPHIERGPIQVSLAMRRIEHGPIQVSLAVLGIDRTPRVDCATTP